LKNVFLRALIAATVAFPLAGATLIHQYVFQGNVNDQVGTADGSLQGGASASGGLLMLDGDGDYVQFAAHLIPTSGSYSVTFIATGPTSFDGYFEMISQGMGGGNGWYIGADSANGMIRASDQWLDTGVPYPTDGQPHRYALVVDTTAATSGLFLDGVLENTSTSAIVVSALGFDTRLGRQFGGISEYFTGTMADVRIYSGALTAGEVAGVPEPSGWLLAATGLAALRLRRRG
jgi:hypothetical protein